MCTQYSKELFIWKYSFCQWFLVPPLSYITDHLCTEFFLFRPCPPVSGFVPGPCPHGVFLKWSCLTAVLCLAHIPVATSSSILEIKVEAAVPTGLMYSTWWKNTATLKLLKLAACILLRGDHCGLCYTRAFGNLTWSG